MLLCGELVDTNKRFAYTVQPPNHQTNAAHFEGARAVRSWLQSVWGGGGGIESLKVCRSLRGFMTSYPSGKMPPRECLLKMLKTSCEKSLQISIYISIYISYTCHQLFAYLRLCFSRQPWRPKNSTCQALR